MKKIIILIIVSFCSSLQAEEYFMSVKTKTSSRTYADSNDVQISFELNKDKALTYKLNNKAFKANALDEFPKIPISIHPKKIEKITVFASAGSNAWYCDYIYFTFYADGKTSQEFKMKIDRFLSTEAGDQGSDKKILSVKKKIKF